MEAVRFDLRWRVALDLPLDHPGLHSSSLVRFRARLLLHGKERLVFERSLELATELGPISGPAGLRFDYRQPRRKPGGDWQDKAARMELLGELALDAARALRAVEQDGEPRGDERVAAAARLLREIVGQEFEPGDGELPRPRGGRRGRRIVSAEDPEMRHARSGAARPFTGYKLHAAADAEAPLLTASALSPGNEHDGQHAGALVDRQPQARRPTRVIGDTAYGNIEAREELDERSLAVLAPVHSASPKDGAIPKEEFRIDLETDTITCPQGKDAAALQAAAESQARASARRDRRSGRPVHGVRLRPLPAARALRTQRPAEDSDHPPRGSAPSCARGPIRSRRARPPLSGAVPDRAPARTDRPPLPSPQESLPRGSKIDVPGALDRRPRQPPSDRRRAAGESRIGPVARRSRHRQPLIEAGQNRRSRKRLFFSGLKAIAVVGAAPVDARARIVHLRSEPSRA